MTKMVRLEIENRLGLARRLDTNFLYAFDSIRRLARKHHRIAEMDCNGVGYIRGYTYYNGRIDDWARREYGPSVRSAYLNTDAVDKEETIFEIESLRIEEKIRAFAKEINATVDFQGDPRGATVKIEIDGKNVTDILWD